MSNQFLSNEFVNGVINENPKPLNELGEFVFYRTYSRWLDNEGRREYWHETARRATEYNVKLAADHMKEIGYDIGDQHFKEEAELLFKNMYNRKQFLSGRTLWVGGANEKINKDFVLGNFNCSFLNIEKWSDLSEIFYLLMVGGMKSLCRQ